jgi:hypothetical protein
MPKRDSGQLNRNKQYFELYKTKLPLNGQPVGSCGVLLCSLL